MSDRSTDEVEELTLLDQHIQRCRDAVSECPKWSPAQAEWSRARDALLNYRDDLLKLTRHESESLTVMREALERLAKAADGYSDTIPDRAHLIYGEVTVGDCRRAREALARIGRS
jgi:hypothetical protein